jgi:hypothetical protein
MATLRGKDAMKGVELLVVKYPNAETKDGKRVFLDAMVRPVEGLAPQRVPHLASKKKALDGRTVYDHQVPYSASQLDAMVAAAGDNVIQMPDRNGKPGPQVIAVKADLMSASGKQSGLVLNTKTLKPSELGPITENTLPELFAHTKAVAEAEKARKAAEKDAQAEVSAEAAAPEVEAAEIEDSEPEF